MNGGAYGREVKDILIDCEVVLRTGQCKFLALTELEYTYRHSELPDGAVVVAATFRGHMDSPEAIQAEMDRIAASREASQPLRSKTVGGAQVSEKHCNFLLNLGDATSTEIEALGEEVRRRVKEKSGVELEWEIQRVGKR